ncbi:zf-HC2 domain-containing protein [Mycolicibacterium sp.]|uniref:anti-sigma factor family protein n=1 Tax=Mycolicibacterium sp. TaxID=2320850 RepID=UPI001A2305D3|nr:zf-HC2 domain-containing protein [Mycolicibacterium sp.]MBJ7341610.1 zf-HC2 domain-containing protein [Mycolicibacterium sp.]
MSDEPLDCNEFVELVGDYVDETLDQESLARVDEHLHECDGCANYLQQFRVTVRTLSTIRDEDVNPALREHLLGAFKDSR